MSVSSRTDKEVYIYLSIYIYIYIFSYGLAPDLYMYPFLSIYLFNIKCSQARVHRGSGSRLFQGGQGGIYLYIYISISMTIYVSISISSDADKVGMRIYSLGNPDLCLYLHPCLSPPGRIQRYTYLSIYIYTYTYGCTYLYICILVHLLRGGYRGIHIYLYI